VVAASRPVSSVGGAGLDMGLLDKSMAARVETKLRAPNSVIRTKKVMQEAGAGGAVAAPVPKAKPARPGQRYATTFLLSCSLKTHYCTSFKPPFFR
jgi:hypothetical protein